MKKQVMRIFLLLLGVCLLAMPALAQGGATIDLSETVTGELDVEHLTREYTFQGESGQMVSITLLSEDYDPLLVLFDENGDEIAYNDDGGGSLNSHIGPLALPADGEYTIVANSYSHYFNNADSEAVGSFTLTLEEVNVRRIEYTQNAKGELTRTQPTGYFQFRGSAGDVINITAVTDGFTANLALSLMTPETLGSTLTTGTDNSGEGVALIGGYALQETANYLIAVTSTTGVTGEFTLEVDKIDVTPLAYGETLDLSFDAETPLAYLSFEGETGDVVSLTVQGDGEFDTTLSLTGPDGYQITYVDDTNGLDPAIVNQILAQPGVYTAIVQPYRPGQSGAVSLTLERGELASLDDGPQTLTMSNNHSRDTLRLSGQAGDAVSLTIEVMNGDLVSPSVTITQNQQSVAYGSGSTVSRLVLDFVVPSDGELYIQVDEYSYRDLSLLVKAESLGAASVPPLAVTTSADDTATATPTPAVPSTVAPVSMPAATDEVDGLIEVTDEPIVETTPAVQVIEPTPAG